MAQRMTGRRTLRRFRVTSFVGRTADLEALARAVEDQPLVTLLGPPGIGKTRLAERYMETQAARAAWLCDLSEVATADQLCAAVARGLDIPLSSESTAAAIEQIGEAIAGRGAALLVLDNAEGSAPHAAATLGRWLLQAPAARFVVTSRDRLRIAGEVVFDLGPLSLPRDQDDARASEAVQLFADRAEDMHRGYALTADEAPRVAELVRLLEGNALAIELAAARMRLLTTTELIESLRDSLDVLSSDALGAPSRHATLRDAIAWSWASLRPWEQAALAQCSVFRGGFGIRAAEAVIDLSGCPGAPPALDVIQALRDKSLLHRYAPPEAPDRARFRLYVGVREFAAEQLAAAGEAAAAEDRHARHHLGAARAPSAEADRRAWRRLALEADNLAAVHERALGRRPHTAAAAIRALEAALALHEVLGDDVPQLVAGLLGGALASPAASEAPPSLRAQALTARGRVRVMLGSIADGESDHQAALAIVGPQGDPRLRGEILVRLAIAAMFDARFGAADEALAAALAVDEPRVRVFALAFLGELRRRQLRAGEAIAAFEEALAGNRRVNDPRTERAASLNIAQLMVDLDRPAQALAHVEAAHATFAQGRDRLAEIVAMAVAARCRHLQGQLDAAEELYARSIDDLASIGSRRNEGICLAHLGALHEAQGRSAEARAACGRALERFHDLAHATQGNVLAVLGSLAATDGDLDAARSCFEEAARRPHTRAVLDVRLGHLDLARARAARSAGDARGAEAHLGAARARLEAGRRDEGGGFDRILGVRILEAALSAIDGATSATAEGAGPSSGVLVISADGLWIEPPRGERTAVTGKLGHLLRALAEHWQAAPGVPLSVEALLESGWPGEKMRHDAGVKRVYTAIWTLRRLGLKDVVLRTGGGYLLDPSAALAIAGSRRGA